MAPRVKRSQPDSPRSFTTVSRESELLDPVCELNQHCLKALALQARGAAAVTLPGLSAEVWRGFTRRACHRAAQFPIVLVDLHFSDTQWWQMRCPQLCVRPLIAARVSTFPPWYGHALCQEALVLAWHMVRLDAMTAAMRFGMVEAVLEQFARFTINDVCAIAAARWPSLSPRWHESHGFWRRLLTAATDEDRAELHSVMLYGFQLLGRDLVPVSTGEQGKRLV